MRTLVSDIVSHPASGKDSLSTSVGLKEFEGMWRGSPNGSLMCLRVVDGKADAPYCYGGDSHLTAHYFNFRRIDNVIFARFKWFTNDIAGYGMYRIISNDKLVGGWWGDEDAVPVIQDEAHTIAIPVRGMNAQIWRRVKDKKTFPAWAKEYFKRIERK
jgi:hypothetical protein